MAQIYLKTQRDPQVVIRALADSLQLSMFDVGKLLTASMKVPVSSWGYDADGNERIFLNYDKLATLPDDELMMMIRHEVLHRAAYGEEYSFENEELGNLALDVVVNKILWLTDPEIMARTTRHVYDDKINNTAIGLARCDLQRDQINEKFRPVWDEVWGSKGIPSVYPIYFALKLDEENVEEAKEQSKSGFGGGKSSPRGDPGPSDETPQDGPMQPSMFDTDDKGDLKPREELTKPPPPPKEPRDESKFREPHPKPKDTMVSDRGESEARKVLQEIKENGVPVGGNFSNMFSRFFSKLEIIKEKTNAEDVEDFLARIRGQQEADDAITRLMAALGLDPRVEVVQGELTTTGLFMLAAGVSQCIGVYWNQVPLEKRPRARIYVDTSPSMSVWAARTVYIIDTLKEHLPTKMYGFAGDVQELDTEEFAKGIYYRGYSTCFDSVVTNMCTSDDEIAVIITDGESSVSSMNKIAAKESGKMFFTILCGSKGETHYNGKDLRDISLETTSLLERPKV